MNKLSQDIETNKLGEKCGIFGISIDNDEAAEVTYNALIALQHRGQESAGIAVVNGNIISSYKDMGLVIEVFADNKLDRLPKSNMAIGHNCYSRGGINTLQNVQPYVAEFLRGRVAVAHNGCLTNAGTISKYLQGKGIGFLTKGDSELISLLIADKTLETGNFIDGIKNAVGMLEGAFSLVIMTSDKKLIAVRDGHGFRPLSIGKNKFGVAVASESCALDSCGFKDIRDIQCGEMVVIENQKIVSSQIVLEKKQSMCIFEYIYFARPDSFIDGLGVYEARYNTGKILAIEHPVDADIVCGVPDSGLEAAAGYANQSGLPLQAGFFKNRYIGRSFIKPIQSQRENAVKLKLNPLGANVNGKRVVLVDDSIVRGTTSKQIISALKDAGAKEVHFRVSSPPFKYTCYFGTDIGSESSLIANNLDIDSIRKSIGADSLGYISMQGLKKACQNCKVGFCDGCFTGKYSVKAEKYE